MPHQIKHSTNL